MIGEIINQTLSNIYVSISEQIPEQYIFIILLVFYTLIITVYAIFVWRFYKFLAKKNIFELNLAQYNTTEHPVLYKFLASCLFLLEYIIILPVLVFFWFSVLAIFLLLLSKSQSVNQILLVSAAIVAATRMTSYYSQDLSKDVAKLFPLTLLVIFILDPNFFSLEKLIARFSEIPSLISNIFIYLVFIAGIEILMRFLFIGFDLIFSSNEK